MFQCFVKNTKKYTVLTIILFFFIIGISCADKSQAQSGDDLAPYAYSVGNWGVNGHGNHRAVVKVETPGIALAEIPWRRHDDNPEIKNIVVENEAGVKVPRNVIENTKEMGKIVFEATTPGKYYVYYMPFTQPQGSFVAGSVYDKPEANAQISADVSAEFLGMEARSEFDSFYPMEIPATEKEFKSLLGKGKDFLLFAENRKYPIKMRDAVPYKWYKSGEVLSFSDSVQPNEIYAFQIGVLPLKDLENVKIEFSDLEGESLIKSQDIHCINMGGKDYLGRPFTKNLNVKNKRVQPLWCYVEFPENAKGIYKGIAKVFADNTEIKTVNLEFNIQGEVLADRGVSDLWRYSRIAWLDSDLAINDELVAPYTPIQVSDNTASILNRKISFDNLGWTDKISSYTKDILAFPMKWSVIVEGKEIEFSNVNKNIIAENQGAYEVEYISETENMTLYVKPRLEFDGCIDYDVKLTAKNPVNVDDVILSLPIKNNVAQYIMGLEERGGVAPDSLEWKWKTNGAANMVWIGTYDAGIQLKLKTTSDRYLLCPPTPKEELPQGWWNNDKGSVMLDRKSDAYYIKASAGERNFVQNESVNYNFRLMITPFKPLDNQHQFHDRLGGPGVERTNVLHIHHATGGLNPYINYPFLNSKELKACQDGLKNVESMKAGSLTYTGFKNSLSGKSGVVHAWVNNVFDWSKRQGNVQFITLEFNDKTLGLYWNTDIRTLRVCAYEGNPQNPKFTLVGDTAIAPNSMKVGDKHLISFAWGENVCVYMDGQLVYIAPFPYVNEDKLSSVAFDNGFGLSAVKIDRAYYGGDVSEKVTDNTVMIDTFKNVKNNTLVCDYANLSDLSEKNIPATKLKNLDSSKGAIHVRAENIFDWSSVNENKSLIEAKFANQTLGLYWNRDSKTLRAYSNVRDEEGNYTNPVVFDTSVQGGSWKIGDKHTISLSWGEKIVAYVDGEAVGEFTFEGAVETPADCDEISLGSDFAYSYVQIDKNEYKGGKLGKIFAYSHDFSNKTPKDSLKGTVKGELLFSQGMKPVVEHNDYGINIYYTCRELTDHVYEMWPLRSLNDEIFDEQGIIYDANGASIVKDGSGGGHPWLVEHLKSDYVPGWYCNLGEDHCAAVATKYVSRWMNYYVNGMDWLMKYTGIDGLYLDGIGYDRQTMKRIARVMESNSKNYRINYHSGNNYDYENWHCNVLNNTMEHLPYVTTLWIGEMFDYNTTADYWFTEMSGIPFGLRNEMLNYQTGGNQWRGMVYAMTGRQNPSYNSMLKFWDDYKIDTTQMHGYWEDNPLAQTGDESIKATVYKGDKFAIVAIGSWAESDMNINLELDFKALGLNEKTCKISMPKIDNFQENKILNNLNNISIEANKGVILVIEN